MKPPPSKPKSSEEVKALMLDGKLIDAAVKRAVKKATKRRRK